MTTNMATTMTAKTPTVQPDGRSEPTNLSFRYGVIGIQAVAAAARYSDIRKKPVDVSTVWTDQRFVESAV